MFDFKPTHRSRASGELVEMVEELSGSVRYRSVRMQEWITTADSFRDRYAPCPTYEPTQEG